MEKETELTTSAHLNDNDALLKALQARGGGLMFKLPQLTSGNKHNNNDDDDNDVSDMVSLKDWQPAPSSHTQQRPSVVREMSPMEAHLNGIQMKGSVRTRYIPLMEPKKPKEVHKEEVNNNKAPLHMVGAPAKLPTLEVVDEGTNNSSSSSSSANSNNSSSSNGHHHHHQAEKEREEEQQEQLDNREPPPIQIHHQHSISLANGIAPEPARGGIAFDISLEDDGMSARSSSRGSSLRVSFVDDVNVGSPSPPRARAPSKSPTRTRSGPLSQSHHHSHQQAHQPHSQSHSTTSGHRPKSNPMPPWESSTKVGPASAPLPKKYVQPTLHGIKVKKGQTTGIKNRLSQPVRNSMPSLEIENECRSNNNGHHHVDKDGYGGWEHRSGQLVGRSLDSHYFGGGEYDSASKLISSNLVSPVESTTEEELQAQQQQKPQQQPQSRKSSGRPFKTRSNGSHKSSDASSEEETNKITGDFGRLFSKLRRASAPLSKPPLSSSQSAAPLRMASAPVKQIVRANSAPSIVAKPVTVAKPTSADPSVGAQKYSIDSYASLKMLQECCSTEKLGLTASYNVQKPRKIRDHEPHRHYYKTISKSIDQKLKGSGLVQKLSRLIMSVMTLLWS